MDGEVFVSFKRKAGAVANDKDSEELVSSWPCSLTSRSSFSPSSRADRAGLFSDYLCHSMLRG